MSDSEFARQTTDCKSIGAYHVFLGSSLVSSQSKKQTVVALSSAAAEYYALSNAVVEIVMMRSILEFLGMSQKNPTLIYVDSVSAKAIAERLADTKRSKTIDVRYNFVQQHIEERAVELAYIPTGDMSADVGTKPLPRESFLKHRDKLVGCFAFMQTWGLA